MEVDSWLDRECVETLRLDPTSFMSDGDLSIDGRPIVAAKAERVSEVEWIAQQRHRASIWLIGEYPVYTETPADT